MAKLRSPGLPERSQPGASVVSSVPRTSSRRALPVLPDDVGCCAPGECPPVDEHHAERLAARFRALADPTRVRILAQLLRCDDTICACDIGASYDLSLPTISHHLKTLRRAGLIHGQRRGTWIHYRPDREAVAAMLADLGALGNGGVTGND